MLNINRNRLEVYWHKYAFKLYLTWGGNNLMYKISFYKDKKGNEPVKEYIISLKAKNTKDSLIKLNKIQDYLNILRQHRKHHKGK